MKEKDLYKADAILHSSVSNKLRKKAKYFVIFYNTNFSRGTLWNAERLDTDLDTIFQCTFWSMNIYSVMPHKY